ncbi:MAG: cation:proton antiporter [Polyangiaceae bacterium]
MPRALFLLVLVLVLIAAARSFLPQETSLVGSGGALAFGFVLLAALESGTIVSGFRMPRLTGYLACGFLAGPSVANFVTERMLVDLKLVNNVAIALIALAAGSELNLKKLRPRLRAILSTGTISLVLAVILIAVGAFLLSRFLPFMDGMSLKERAVVSLVMGVVLAALSPTVVLAILGETGAAGPISETILGLVVLGDLVIIFAFAGVSALANATFATAGAGGGGVTELFVHIFGSIAVGLVLGVVFWAYLKRVTQRVALFVFAICFVSAEVGTRLHLDPLLMCLAAGLFIENFTDIEGQKLIHDIEIASVPVFALFFAVAGAGLHWHVFREVAPIALVLATIRAIALVVGSRIGMALGQVPPEHRKTIPYGLLSQSGIAIGLAILVKKTFPGWGDGASACLLGGVMLNEVVGPVLFRMAMMRTDEAGRRAVVAGGH